MNARDPSELSMAELFRIEAESQTAALTAGLLALERHPTDAMQLEACMRAAHSLKGAARIVDLTAAVTVAHAMEDCFVAAQRGTVTLYRGSVDVLLAGVDLLSRCAKTPESDHAAEADAFATRLAAVLDSDPPSGNGSAASDAFGGPMEPVAAMLGGDRAAPPADRTLRVTAENLNSLLALAGESLVEARWLAPFAASLTRLKHLHVELSRGLDRLRESIRGTAADTSTLATLAEAQQTVHRCRQALTERLTELDAFDRRSTNLSGRLYDRALACRQRPFADGVAGFPRAVRDLGRSLGRDVRCEIIGAYTQVDRDLLERLEAPLNHLVRNAVDHGVEPPEERVRAGKPPEAIVRLEALHSAGMLLIVVSDDGRGIDVERVRRMIVERQLASAETAGRMSEDEVLQFLFLPGFTTKEAVSEVSGRGVGLDVVHTMVKQVRGMIRVTSVVGQGTRFQLQLPLTLSVVRALLVEVGGEPYAFPLAFVTRTVRLPRERIETLEGRQHFDFDGRHVGLVTAHQILEGGDPKPESEELPVVVLGDGQSSYGLVVDRLLGERSLVVQPLDSRLGKVKDISAAAVMGDGSPVLIVDVDDMVRSIDQVVSAGRPSTVLGETVTGTVERKRVLVVDDSFTARELERKLLESRGYLVTVAVDGMDGWNAVRTGRFHLVVTDIDMPRMDGIELVTLIKKDPRLQSLPVMIVSYKDREEDRQRGFEAGADYCLSKGSFHDEVLLSAVQDLIGEARV